MKPVFTARNMVAFTLVFILGYILWIGPYRFYIESTGTWILSPIIYVRLLPMPLSSWLLTSLVQFPLLGHFLCAVPLFLIAIAIASAAYSVQRNSFPFAVAAWLIVGSVFSVYHYVQPMGITLVRF